MICLRIYIKKTVSKSLLLRVAEKMQNYYTTCTKTHSMTDTMGKFCFRKIY